MTGATNRFEIVGHGRAGALLKHVRQRASRRARQRILFRDLRSYRPPARRRHASCLVSFLGDLQERLREASAISPAPRCLLLLQDEEPIESVPWLLKRLGIRSPARVHLGHVESGQEACTLLRRFTEALAARNPDESILDAWWEGGTLIVLSPGTDCFRRLAVPLDALPPRLRRARRKDRENFAIDEYGDLAYWPALDIHMGWAQFEQAAQPEARLRAEQRSQAFNERYGRAIRSLREKHGLHQQDVEGLAERTVRRLEKGQTKATVNAIRKLAAAHGMTPAAYMAEVAGLLEHEVAP